MAVTTSCCAPDEVACGEETGGRARLREQVSRWFQAPSEVRDRFLELIDSDLGIGALADLVAFALPLDAEFKQSLLEELDAAQRLERLLRHLGEPRRAFPPEFSPN